MTIWYYFVKSSFPLMRNFMHFYGICSQKVVFITLVFSFRNSGISNKFQHVISLLLSFFSHLFLSSHLISSLCCSKERGGRGSNECMKVTPHMYQKYAIIQKGKQLRKNKSCFNVLELVLKNTDVLYAYEIFD